MCRRCELCEPFGAGRGVGGGVVVGGGGVGAAAAAVAAAVVAAAAAAGVVAGAVVLPPLSSNHLHSYTRWNLVGEQPLALWMVMERILWPFLYRVDVVAVDCKGIVVVGRRQ